MIFELIIVAHINSHIVYTKVNHDISLLSFKIVVPKATIGRCSNCKRLSPSSGPSKRKSHEPFMPKEVPTHMFEYQEKGMRCHY